jgi:hypothetical protein
MKNLKSFEEVDYSDVDLARGRDERGEIPSFGITIDFKKDFRRKVLAIKKLVRIKYQINDPQINDKIDEVLDMMEKMM